MMEQYDKAAIVRLTDTEKSYIELKMDENNLKTVIIQLSGVFCRPRNV